MLHGFAVPRRSCLAGAFLRREMSESQQAGTKNEHQYAVAEDGHKGRDCLRADEAGGRVTGSDRSSKRRRLVVREGWHAHRPNVGPR
jgi:hypothetical protein